MLVESHKLNLSGRNKAMGYLTQRVVARFVAAASVPVGLAKILRTLVDGSASLGRQLENVGVLDTLTHWDKEDFYRSDQDRYLLEKLLATATPKSIFSVLDPIWRSVGSEGFLDEGWGAELEWDNRKTFTLSFRAMGPIFSRYSEDHYELPYADRQSDISSYIEVPEDDAFLDSDIQRLTKVLGAEPWYGSHTRRKSSEEPGMGEYDYFEYDVRLVFKVDPEALIRQSIGKLVDEAGQALKFDSTNEEAQESAQHRQSRPSLVEPGDILTLERRYGEWPKAWAVGTKFKVVRGGRSGDKISAVLHGDAEKHYFRVRQSSAGIYLEDPHSRDQRLKVTKIL